MKVNKFKRGQIWWYETNNIYDGNIQGKTRPVIIISNDIANSNSNNITVIPCTTKVKRMDIPTHYKFMLNDVENIALCEQILTINNLRLKDYEGTCDAEIMHNIANCIKIAIGLTDAPTILYETEPIESNSLNTDLQLDNTESQHNTKVNKRGRHTKYNTDYMQRYLNDYVTHKIDFMIKKYNECSAKAVTGKIYRFRKLLVKGE